MKYSLITVVTVCFVGGYLANAVSRPGFPFIDGCYDANEGQFPYQAFLLRLESPSCGAVIIAPQFVLTDSYCIDLTFALVFPVWKTFKVRVGSLTERTGLLLDVATIAPADKFREHGVALVKLVTPLTFNRKVAAIPITSSYAGRELTVLSTKWARLQYSRFRSFRADQCPGFTNSICLGRFANTERVCDTNNGDAVIDGRNALYGLSSFSRRLSGPPNRVGFIMLNFYTKWISSTMQILQKLN